MALTAAPPSYEAAMGLLGNKVGARSNLGDIKSAVEGVPTSLINKTSTANEDGTMTMTDQQKRLYADKIMDVMTSDAGSEAVKSTIQAAVDAVQTIDNMFTSLQTKLKQIDDKYTDPNKGAFAPKLVDLYTRWQTAVRDSKTMAVNTATYASRFSELILPLLQDDGKEDLKKQKLEEMVNKAGEFKISSLQMQVQYNKITSDFNTFQASFSDWASTKSTELDARIEQIGKDINDLNEKIQQKEKEIIGVGAGAAATLPLTGVIGILSGPFAPFVIIGGLVAAGALTATMVALAVEKSNLQDQKSGKQKDLANLNAEKKDIDDTRKGLVQLGADDLQLLRTNMAALNKVWELVTTDVMIAQNTLQEAKGDINWSTAFNRDINKVTAVYALVASYLSDYAKGIKL